MSNPICIGDPTSLFRLQYGILRTLVAVLDTSPFVGAGGSKLRTYVSIGDPAFDQCPQLTVHAANIRMAPGWIAPSGERYCVSEYQVDIVTNLVRCYPAEPDTKPDMYTDVAEILNYDAALIYFRFECALMAGELSDILTDCKLNAPGIMNPISPQAGMAGWTWNWTFNIPSCPRGTE